MNTYTTDNIEVRANGNEVVIKILDNDIKEYCYLSLTYDEYRKLAKSFEYIEEMRKVTECQKNTQDNNL